MNPSPFRLSIYVGRAAAGGCRADAGRVLSVSRTQPPVITPACSPDQTSKPGSRCAGKIDVEGGLLISSAASGVVQQLLVKEGQSVQKGQPVLRLADDAARADLAVASPGCSWRRQTQDAPESPARAPKATLTRWQSAAKQGSGPCGRGQKPCRPA